MVRNILAACVRQDRGVSPSNGHAVLLYDERNPAFQEGGAGAEAFRVTREALRDAGLLRRCSWQRVVANLRNDPELLWLTERLQAKYGL